MFIGWFAKATVLLSFPISTYIIHKSTGNSYFVISQIGISQARPYSRFFILMHSILIISVFINKPEYQNTTSTITHQNEFVGFEIQSIMTPLPRAFMRYFQHLNSECFYFHHYLVILTFYLYTFIYKSIPFIFHPLFSKQHHHPKSSLLLLNPISKQYYAALVVHNSFS